MSGKRQKKGRGRSARGAETEGPGEPEALAGEPTLEASGADEPEDGAVGEVIASETVAVTETVAVIEPDTDTVAVIETVTVTETVTEIETGAQAEAQAGAEPDTGALIEPEAESVVDEGELDTDFPFGSNVASSVGTLGADDEELEIEPVGRPGLEKAPPLPTGEAHLKGVIESLLFVTDKPLPANRLAKIARASTREVQRLLDVLTGEYQGRGIELVEVAGGYQFRSSAENAPFVRELVARKPVRLTRAQIETLSILAYRQPITRPEIDEIRGVDSGSALKVLLDKSLVRIIGRKEEPGRPLLYGTTPYFLEFFGLPSLAELPTLREYSELSDESRALFQRRTGEAIDTIGDLGVEARHYSEDEVEAEEAQAARRLHGEDEQAGDEEQPDAQGELALDTQGELGLEAPQADGEPADDDEDDEEEDEGEE